MLRFIVLLAGICAVLWGLAALAYLPSLTPEGAAIGYILGSIVPGGLLVLLGAVLSVFAWPQNDEPYRARPVLRVVVLLVGLVVMAGSAWAFSDIYSRAPDTFELTLSVAVFLLGAAIAVFAWKRKGQLNAP